MFLQNHIPLTQGTITPVSNGFSTLWISRAHWLVHKTARKVGACSFSFVGKRLWKLTGLFLVILISSSEI